MKHIVTSLEYYLHTSAAIFQSSDIAVNRAIAGDLVPYEVSVVGAVYPVGGQGLAHVLIHIFRLYPATCDYQYYKYCLSLTCSQW